MKLTFDIGVVSHVFDSQGNLLSGRLWWVVVFVEKAKPCNSGSWGATTKASWADKHVHVLTVKVEIVFRIHFVAAVAGGAKD